MQDPAGALDFLQDIGSAPSRFNAPVAPPTSVAVVISADSKFAYALNDQTRDVTIIDVQAATVLSKIGIPSGYLTDPSWKIETMPSGNAVSLVGWWGITFIDTKTN
jgi:6-phosphogluconolactonase (cycloisomerase 2 family)